MTATLPDAQFCLRDIAKEVLDTTTATDIRQMADEVAARVPVQHLRFALADTLVPYLRNVQALTRCHAIAASKSEEDDQPRTPVSSQVALRYAGVPAYLTWIRSFVAIPGNGQKRRCEIGLDEQRAIAEYKKAQAAAVLKETQREFMFVAALEKHKAEKLGDLPETVVLEILRWEPEK